MWDYRASVLKVKDGDTLRVLLDRGFDETKEIDLRLFDTWAPEKTDSGGPETKAHATEWVDERSEGRWPFVVILERTKRGDHEVSTLGRYVGTLLDPQGDSLNSAVTAFVSARGYGHGTGFEGGA
jgi:endonuclease YncB( thermonuclease family)